MATARSALFTSVVAIVTAITGCRNEHASSTTAPSPGGNHRGDVAATPGDRVCLPAMVCVEWAGCALVATDGTGKGTVVSADRLKAGEPVRLENGCNNGASCPAAKASPRDVVCPPIEIPPIIAPPGYTCVLDGAHCHKR